MHAMRQNDLMLGDERVLRIPLIGLRTEPGRFMRQVVRAYQRGCRRYDHAQTGHIVPRRACPKA